MGRCPFHEERTPSFSVNPVDKLYYCFGCAKGGDMIDVRPARRRGSTSSARSSGSRSGSAIPIEYEETLARGGRAAGAGASACSQLLEDAARFYERYLWESPAGSFARDYLAGRGLGEAVCREFRLGLALGGATLARKAREKGFTAEELRAAGLTGPRGGDYFQRRLVFPLADARGRVLGFQARRLHEDDPLRAKYVNTPESELFHEGRRSSTGSTGRARRSPARTAPASSRATPTCSRCGRPGSSRSSRAWARR